MVSALFGTKWHTSGTSWIWDERARDQVCRVNEVWSLRQFLQMKWPEDLPSNEGRSLIVAGLEGSLDLLTPDEAEIWLETTIKTRIQSFQSSYQNEAGLIFWLPKGNDRLSIASSTDEIKWHWVSSPHQPQPLEWSRILWGNANESLKSICVSEKDKKEAGWFYPRIT